MRRLLHRMRSDESGFTLIEMLMAATIGIVVLGAATLIVYGAAKHNNEVASRTDATQRGRLAMERMTQVMRSQMCVGTQVNTITSASPTSVTFYADIKGGGATFIHTIAYDSTKKSLTDEYAPVATPTVKKKVTLADNIVLPTTTTLFRYWAYPVAEPATGAWTPSEDLTTTGTVTDSNVLRRIARIDIDFFSVGPLKTTSKIRAEMTDQVFMRRSDPNASSPAPACA